MRTNLLKLLAVLGLAALVAGCKKNETIPTYTLQVLPRTLSFGAQETGVQKRLEVTTTGPGYTHTIYYSGDQKDWLAVTQGADFLDVAVKSANPGNEERKATIDVIVLGLDPITVDVTQRAEGDQTDYSITLDPATLRFAASGSELKKTSTVTTKGNGLLAETEGILNWYEAYIEDNTTVVTVIVQPNTTDSQRSGKVTVTNAQGKSATLTIVQDAPRGDYPVTLDPAQLTFAAAGTELTKTVSVTTSGTGATAQVGDSYREWLDAALEGSTLTVTVTANPGAERKGTITVSNAEGGSAVLNITQKSASDYGITLDPASLNFSSDGSGLTQKAVITTNGTGLSADVDDEDTQWLSASIEGNTLWVTVTPYSGYGTRTGSVSVHNAEGEDADLQVTQSGLPVPDITGTWNWSSLYSTDGTWNNASEISGTATITRSGDDYILTGIAGSAVKSMNVTDPRFHLDTENGVIGLTDGEAFTQGPPYYSAPSLTFPAATIIVWNSDNAFVELGIEDVNLDGIRYRRITFPQTLLATSALFPDDQEVWNQTGTVSYAYYQTIQMGWEERNIPLEYHRNVVLLKQL